MRSFAIALFATIGWLAAVVWYADNIKGIAQFYEAIKLDWPVYLAALFGPILAIWTFAGWASQRVRASKAEEHAKLLATLPQPGRREEPTLAAEPLQAKKPQRRRKEQFTEEENLLTPLPSPLAMRSTLSAAPLSTPPLHSTPREPLSPEPEEPRLVIPESLERFKILARQRSEELEVVEEPIDDDGLSPHELVEFENQIRVELASIAMDLTAVTAVPQAYEVAVERYRMGEDEAFFELLAHDLSIPRAPYELERLEEIDAENLVTQFVTKFEELLQVAQKNDPSGRMLRRLAQSGMQRVCEAVAKRNRASTQV